jgi:hypothetical protein
MKKILSLALSISFLLAGVFYGPGVRAAQADTLTILQFSTMVGVPKAYTGTNSPIRGINGGGLPWVIRSGRGELSAGGKLEVRVSGLVLDPNDPDVIARGLAGNNPIAAFMVTVSCQSVDANGLPVVVNVTTNTRPATTGLSTQGGGNAKFETHVDLPKPCIAPIIFVGNAGGAWFASTGF